MTNATDPAGTTDPSDADSTDSSDKTPRESERGPAVELVPRFSSQGYAAEDIAKRRDWIEAKTGASLDLVGKSGLDPDVMRGNIENPIGSVQMPLGVAGPLHIKGQGFTDTVYVPMATTEGALVRSYERGMAVLTRAGGVSTRIDLDVNRVSPAFRFDSLEAADWFAREVPQHFDALASVAGGTTRHGRLVSLDPHCVGRRVLLEFRYFTGDAQGMNMLVRATEEACRWMMSDLVPRIAEGFEAAHESSFGECHVLTFSGHGGEKRAAADLLSGGKGKRAHAAVRIPRRLLRLSMRVTPEDMLELWRSTIVGHLYSGSVGFNGHAANGLAALFIACGQDVANVANASVALSVLEVLPDGDLYASTTLPSLTVATVGGGTALGTSRECLQMLGCWDPEQGGTGLAPRFAQIAAAMVLAGEISFSAAIASGEFVAAHERYGRNRPDQDRAEQES